MCNVFAPSYSQKIFNQSITNQGMSVYLVAELFCQNAIFPLKVMETEMMGNGNLAYDCTTEEEKCKFTELQGASTLLLVQ